MKEFVGKKIKVYLDVKSGLAMDTGLFMSSTGNFIVIKSDFRNKVEFINIDYIKLIEIVGEANGKD